MKTSTQLVENVTQEDMNVIMTNMLVDASVNGQLWDKELGDLAHNWFTELQIADGDAGILRILEFKLEVIPDVEKNLFIRDCEDLFWNPVDLPEGCNLLDELYRFVQEGHDEKFRCNVEQAIDQLKKDLKYLYKEQS